MNVAVIQPLPGIGDMIWHLPHIRAVAEAVGGPVTLVAKPRSAADQIFRAEATVRDVIWLDRNPEDRRGRHDGGVGSARVVATLRRRRFDAVYVLHHSRTLACLAMLAGIPARHGYGFGLQRVFLNRAPFLPPAALRLHPFEQATAWLVAAGIPLAQTEPILPVTTAAREIVRQRLGETDGSMVAIGIGSSEPYKQWGAQRFAALGNALLDATPDRLVLIGGPSELALAQEIQTRSRHGPARIVAAIGWDLGEIAALCAGCRFYVGNDTGIMNIAAAVGIRSYGLFGGTPPFHHSSRIVPITPPGAIARSGDTRGMAQITTQAVLRAIGPDLTGGREPASYADA
jgi:heptosyltransferase-2